MVRNPPYLTTFPNKSHKGTTFYKTAGEKADKKRIAQGGMPSVLPKAPCRSCIFPIEPNMCAFSRKRLCIFTQTFASAVSNVCIGGFKRLRPRFQTFASVVSNVCVQIGQKSGMGVCLSFWPDWCRGGMLFPVPLIPTSLQQNSSLLLI